MKNFRVIVLLLSTFFWAGCFDFKLGNSNKSDKVVSSQLTAQNSGGGWKDAVAKVAGGVFLGAENSGVFYAFDNLAHPNEPVELTSRVQTVKLLKALPGVTIAYYLDTELIDQITTDRNGYATVSWTPRAIGNYVFSVQISEVPQDMDQELLGMPPTSLVVAVRAKETPFVVIDLDHTVVDSSFFRVLLGGGRPMADSVEVTHKIAKKYSLIYLTHRPDLLTQRSKSWLRKYGYPLGPLLVSDLTDSFGSSGKYKTTKLATIKESFPQIQTGIGDKLSDAQAYLDNGMTAYLIPHYDHDDPEDMQEMAQELRRFRGQTSLNVVLNWREIEKGIFQGKKYPAEEFADWLEKQARRLEEDEDDD